MKLLMHTCCAPCSVYCIDSLRKEDIEPTCYWFNPNIHPYSEYTLRRDTLIKYTNMINVKLIIEENYGLKEFCKNVVNDIDNRCVNYCYKTRLEQTVKYAKENGFDAFTTTLFVSPYQKHDKIKEICENLSQKYEIEFLYRDFRVGYFDGQEKAKELGLYRQKYCGCIFSLDANSLHESNERPNFPVGFEWPKKKQIEVRRLEDNDNKITYELNLDEEKISTAILEEVDKNTVELKYIETVENERNKGYASRLIKSLAGNYKQKYKYMLVGSDAKNIPFFVKNGFENYKENNNNISYYEKYLR